MSLKFRKRGDRKVVRQHFDKEKIFITKHGQTYNQYDSIQAANVDTNIYEVMKKYHCMADQAEEIMRQKGGMPGVFGDFQELQKQIQNFADIEKVKNRAQKMFEALPLEVREKYGHNLGNFLEDSKKFQQEQKKLEKLEKNIEEGK